MNLQVGMMHTQALLPLVYLSGVSILKVLSQQVLHVALAFKRRVRVIEKYPPKRYMTLWKVIRLLVE